MGDKFLFSKIALATTASLLFLTGCSSGTTTIRADDTASQSEETEQLQVEDQNAREVSEPQVTEEETQQSSQDSALGSRNTPFDFGQSVTLKDNGVDAWEVQFLGINPDAEDVLLEENMFNDPAPEGFVYAMLEIQYTYLGEDRGTPAFDLDLAFVTAEGTTHKSSDVSVVTPNDVFGINELYNGGSAVGNEAIAIPVDSLETGTWRLSIFIGDEIYIEGAPNA